ncbi:MAG: N-acetylglucosamine-6-phosphate deacetylase [Phycisphaeraceae bacterium]|nr:N-acetylglucosamine-6-phosphate deacetylase [Phycisphaeraceae bacterium]
MFDIQVNGYGGVDFNSDDLSVDALHQACAKLREDGVTGILATIITEKLPVMAQRLARLVQLREQDDLIKAMIRGFHIEGPFISPMDGYRGAHPQDAVCPATVDDMKLLQDSAGGLTRLVTLAPEYDARMQTIAYLAKQGITISAGHCNSSMNQLHAAIDAGLSMYTHLGNGCPANMPRHDNIVQRVLSLHDKLWLCFIADGVHIPMFALKNYLNIAGSDRCIITTDAIAPAGLGPGTYTLSRWTLQIGEDLAARSEDGSHLVGSAIDMPRVIQNLQQSLGMDQTQIEKLICKNPRKAIGL